LRGTGSGFFINSSGVAVTNHHVVVGAHGVVIITEDGNEYNVSGYYSYDINNDLSVIQVDGAGKRFSYLDIGNSDVIRVGETVYAIGSPDGDQNTFSISYVSRLVPTLSFGIYTVNDMLQITAPIYPGSSGGALLNSRGQVVGVTSAVNLQRPTVAFVVPISRVDVDSANGRLLPLPVGAPVRPSPGTQQMFARFPFIPDFMSISNNAELFMAGTPTVLDFYLDDSYEFDYIYIYDLSSRHFVADTDRYDIALEAHGFVMQDIVNIDDSTMVFLYHAAHNVSLAYLYLWDYEALVIGVGQGNAYEMMLLSDFIGYALFPFIPDFGAFSSHAVFLDMGMAYEFFNEDISFDGNLYVVIDFDWVYAYDFPVRHINDWVQYDKMLEANGFTILRDTYYENHGVHATLYLPPCESLYVSILYDLDEELLLVFIG
jgi:hypothetical protein